MAFGLIALGLILIIAGRKTHFKTGYNLYEYTTDGNGNDVVIDNTDKDNK